MTPSTFIEIDQKALANNIRFIHSILQENVLFSSVVKGNAYGHGIETIVPLLEQEGVSHFSTFNAEEAFRVRHSLTKPATIMIMGMLTEDQMEWAIEHGVEFFAFNFERLALAQRLAKKIGRAARIHVELETGMNRTGFQPQSVGRALDFILDCPELAMVGLCSHFAGAESISNYHRVKKQTQVYKKKLKQVQSATQQPFLRHMACSAAALRNPSTQMDMVRIGILQYGFFPSKEVMIQFLPKSKLHEDPLQRVISWKSQVMGIKTVKQGEFVGYGTSYFANTDMVVATVPVGYSHGFSRSLSNQGRVLIRNKRVTVVGIVNMNMITVDVTDVEGVGIGDEVVLIGSQGDMEISVASFSDTSNQVNYEMLTRLPSEIPRYVK